MKRNELRLHADDPENDQKDNEKTSGEVRWGWAGGRVLFSKIQGWVLVSVVGILCLCSTFAYALWVILKIVEAK